MLGKRKKEAGGLSIASAAIRLLRFLILCEVKAQKDSGKPKWKEQLEEDDDDSGEGVTAEDMEEWRQREEVERRAREAREAEETKKRREAERAAAAEAAAAEERRKARSESKKSKSSKSSSYRSRSRRRRRSSSSSRSSSKSRKKSGWDVADSSLLAQAAGMPSGPGGPGGPSSELMHLPETKPMIVPPPPPPVLPRAAGDASPLPQTPPRPGLEPFSHYVHPPHPPQPPQLHPAPNLPPPPPPPPSLNGAMLNAPVHGQPWEKLQDTGHFAPQQMANSMATSMPQPPQPWAPNLPWQAQGAGQMGSWNQAQMWQDPFQGWPGAAGVAGVSPVATSMPVPSGFGMLQATQGIAWSPPIPTSDRNEERFIGRVKRFQEGPGGGYGFIDCDEAKLRFTRDIYIHRNQMVGLQIGDEVSFTIVLNNKGEPQARNVMKREDALLLRASAVHGMVPEGPTTATSSLMDEHQARQFQAALRSG